MRGFFQPRDQRLEGIRCTHIERCGWRLRPCDFYSLQRRSSPEASARASSYRPEELTISPYFLKLRLARYRCFLELAPTERCSVMRFTFRIR